MKILKGGKQPAETFMIGVDFATLLADGETISSGGSSVTAVDGNGESAAIISSGSMSVNGSTLSVRLTGGTDGTLYKVSFRAATSASNLYEQDIQVGVAD